MKRGSLVAAGGALTASVGVVVVMPLLAMGSGDLDPPSELCLGTPVGDSVDGSPTILGRTTPTHADLVDWWTSTGHGQPDALGLPIEDVLALYLAEAETEGVRGDLAIVQAVHETGWFTSSDTARNNFAGIRHYDDRPSSDSFPDVATGVRAHVQLLKKYAAGNDVTLARRDVAPEAMARATTWGALAGTWATSPDYWSELSQLHNTMLASAGVEDGQTALVAATCDPTQADVAAVEGSPGNVPLTIVHGITVHSDIAHQVAALIDAARADGHVFAGSGYRSPERQIELRRAHCGTTDYAIYEMPSSQCTPPTARPGSSNHELGLAIDVECDGVLIRSRSSACFTWLAANAPNFGLYNLPSEPWHWSIDGT